MTKATSLGHTCRARTVLWPFSNLEIWRRPVASHPHLHDQLRLGQLPLPLTAAHRDVLHLILRVLVKPLVDHLIKVRKPLIRHLAVKRLAMARARPRRDRFALPLLMPLSDLLLESADLRCRPTRVRPRGRPS